MILTHLRQAIFSLEASLAILSEEGEELGLRPGRLRPPTVRTFKFVAIQDAEAKILT